MTDETVQDIDAPLVARDPLGDEATVVDAERPETGPAFVEETTGADSHMQSRAHDHPDAPPLVAHVEPEGWRRPRPRLQARGWWR